MKKRNILFGVFLSLFFFTNIASADVKIRAESGGDKPLVGYTPKVKKFLKLNGSRGETLNFLVRLQGSGNARLKVKKFSSPKLKGKINFPVKFYELKAINLRHASFPGSPTGEYYDPLIPLNNSKKIKISGTQWFWGEIEIPVGTKPARYKTTLQFGRSAIPFNLRVWKMTMPSKPTLPMYGEISPIDVQLGHYGRYNDYKLSALDMPLYKKYIDELKKHRAYSLRSYDYAFLSNPVQHNGKKILDVFNTPDQTTSYQSIFINNIPNGVYYDFATPKYGRGGYFSDMKDLKRFKGYYQAMQNSVEALNLSNNFPITFMWDEPFMNAWQWKKSSEYWQVMNKVQTFAQTIKSWAPSVKVVVTAPCYSDLYGSVDIVASAPNYIQVGQNKGDGIREGTIADCQKLQNKGVESWWYVSCMSHGCSEGDVADSTPDMIIERRSTFIRSIAWMQYKYKFTGFYYFNFASAYKGAEFGSDPWEDFYNFTGNGDGTLVYPGRPGERGLVADQPILSIRLKQWRETSFDAEYLKWFSQMQVKPVEISKGLDSLIKDPKHWEINYLKYSNLRKKIGDYLDKNM